MDCQENKGNHTTKKSVSQLLGEVEGRSGTLASFPDRWPTKLENKLIREY